MNSASEETLKKKKLERKSSPLPASGSHLQSWNTSCLISYDPPEPDRHHIPDSEPADNTAATGAAHTAAAVDTGAAGDKNTPVDRKVKKIVDIHTHRQNQDLSTGTNTKDSP